MPACSRCGALVSLSTSFKTSAGHVVCHACWTTVQKRCRCEECGSEYGVGGYWFNERVCRGCMDKIRRQIGEPALDADLTAEERQYLAETFGLESYDDDATQQYDPYCRSCIDHGADRKNYPCLREQCRWQRDVEYERRTLNYPRLTNTTTLNTWTINTGTSTNSWYYRQ